MKRLLLAVLLIAFLAFWLIRDARAQPSGYTQCATEHGTCSVPASGANVVYGTPAALTSPKHFTADVLCDNTTFVDPAVGATKTCWLLLDSAAVAPPACLPKTSLTPNACGSQLVTTRTGAGECGGWWVPTGTMPDGRQGWAVKKQCVLDKYRGKSVDPLTIAKAILLSADPVAAVSAAASAATIAPVGAQEVYDFAYLNWANCQTMTKAVNMPPGVVIVTNNCGSVPVAQAPAADIWRALGTSIYTAANGKLVAPVAGARAAAAAPCDASATPIVAGAVTYLPLVGAPATQVTSCKKASQ